MNRNQIRGDSDISIVAVVLGVFVLIIFLLFIGYARGLIDGRKVMELEAVKRGNGEYYQEEQKDDYPKLKFRWVDHIKTIEAGKSK